MKFINKKVIVLSIFSFLTMNSAYCDQYDTAILSNNFQVLKNIENKMEKYHKDDILNRTDLLQNLHNDMRQMNTYLLDIDIMLRQIMNNQNIEMQKKNKQVSLLGEKENKEKEEEKKEQK